MTQEEKASAYDVLLTKAKQIYNKENDVLIIHTIEDLFPEVRKNEDERIRKALTDFFGKGAENGEQTNGVCDRDILAWLEKQDNESVNIDIESMVSSYKQRLKNQAGIENSPFLNMCLTVFRRGIENTLEELNLKQGEQKLIDNIEPKFKVGDWISNDMCDVHIASIEDGMYYFDEGDGLSIVFVNEHYHLWTIEDAMEGDVLFQDLMDGKTFIYNGVNSDKAILYSFIISNDGEDVLPYHIGKPNTGIGHIEENKGIIRPANKEQRDLLFQKMKEAGYEWDADKKEPKKIETEIEIPFGAKDSELQEATYFIPKGFHAEIDNDKVVIKKGEKPAEWSEEDEHRVKDTIYFLDTAKKHYASAVELDACIDWLKSLEDRVQPKEEWSEEDERICQCLIEDQENALDEVRNDKYGHSEIISDLKEMYRERIDWLKSLRPHN